MMRGRRAMQREWQRHDGIRPCSQSARIALLSLSGTHECTCDGCNSRPLMGFRYKCTKVRSCGANLSTGCRCGRIDSSAHTRATLCLRFCFFLPLLLVRGPRYLRGVLRQVPERRASPRQQAQPGVARCHCARVRALRRSNNHRQSTHRLATRGQGVVDMQGCHTF